MTPAVTFRSSALLALACLTSLVTDATAGPDSKKDCKCQGTKQERKQKFDKRTLSDEQFDAMVAAYEKQVAADLESMKQAAERRLEKKYAEHQATGAPFVYDMLVLSGGGSKGAFGSGFLEGWGKVPQGPDARPQFDVVTGVSTGALIAPFAFIGTDESYRTIADLYANPQPDWAKKRGWLPILPKHSSLFNNCRLRDAIRAACDPAVTQAVAKGAADDRLLLVGVTNLDLGVGRVLDVGKAAQMQPVSSAQDAIVGSLIASSSIPGAFAPVLMDGMLYADGGATSNLFIVGFPGPDGPVGRFKKRHPDAPAPTIRMWIILNQKLVQEHVVTQPKWIDVSRQALDTLTFTSQLFALNLMRQMADDVEAVNGVDVEVRFASIPASGPEQASKSLFDKPYMLALQQLGRTMGADPASWQTKVPTAMEQALKPGDANR